MIVVTRCQILRLKCTKFDFGSAPNPAGKVYSTPQTSWLNLRGPTFEGRQERGGDGKRGQTEGRGGEGGTCSKVLGRDRRPCI